MEVKATVKLTSKEVFGFLMHNTYSTVSSYLSILLSVAALVGFFYMYDKPNANPAFLVALIAIGLLFTVIQPMMLYFKAKKQIKKNEAINEALNYSISKSGIEVTQGEQSASTSWEEIVRITSTKNLIILYTNRVNAYVIPKNDVEGGLDTLKKIIRENCDAGYIKLWK